MSVRALGAIYIIQKFGMLENVHSMENVTCACSNLPQRTEHHLQTWLKAITKRLKYRQHLGTQLLVSVGASQASCKYERSPNLKENNNYFNYVTIPNRL